MNADELLKEIQVAYLRGGRVWRDNLLACGAKLHDYILAHVKQGEGLPEARRLKANFTREEAVKNAAAALDVARRNILQMLQGAAVARLLAEDGNVGRLSWISVWEFASLLRRRTGRFNDYATRVEAGRNGVAVTAIEEWEVRPQYDGAAQSLFRQAVAQGDLTRDQVYAMILKLRGQRARQGRHAATAGQQTRDDEGEYTLDAFERQQTAARLASPGDVADMCLVLVEKARDPAAVALRLRVMLQKYLPQKQRA